MKTFWVLLLLPSSGVPETALKLFCLGDTGLRSKKVETPILDKEEKPVLDDEGKAKVDISNVDLPRMTRYRVAVRAVNEEEVHEQMLSKLYDTYEVESIEVRDSLQKYSDFCGEGKRLPLPKELEGKDIATVSEIMAEADSGEVDHGELDDSDPDSFDNSEEE